MTPEKHWIQSQAKASQSPFLQKPGSELSPKTRFRATFPRNLSSIMLPPGRLSASSPADSPKKVGLRSIMQRFPMCIRIFHRWNVNNGELCQASESFRLDDQPVAAKPSPKHHPFRLSLFSNHQVALSMLRSPDSLPQDPLHWSLPNAETLKLPNGVFWRGYHSRNQRHRGRSAWNILGGTNVPRYLDQIKIKASLNNISNCCSFSESHTASYTTVYIPLWNDLATRLLMWNHAVKSEDLVFASLTFSVRVLAAFQGTITPFKVVHQRPPNVAPHIYPLRPRLNADPSHHRWPR